MRLLGAVIGDISGSWYEFRGFKQRPAALVTQRDFFTDDSVLTLAVAEGMMNGFEQVDRTKLMQDESAQNAFRLEIVKSICEFAHRYPDAGYGNTFLRWYIEAYERKVYQPYNSWGNGSAMRASFAGWAAQSLEEALLFGQLSAEVTHNHPEGIKGAQATAMCIFLARKGASKDEIQQCMEQEFGYRFPLTIAELQKRYSWNGVDGEGNGGICQDSVPQAIQCALQATDFEDAVRNAISIGGDSDTIGCITGSIAEALYGVPANMCEKAMTYLPENFQKLVTEFEAKYGSGLRKTEGR